MEEMDKGSAVTAVQGRRDKQLPPGGGAENTDTRVC